MMNSEEQVIEVHRQYIDVHFPLDRAEIIGVKPLADCTALKSSYNEKDDYAYILTLQPTLHNHGESSIPKMHMRRSLEMEN